MKTALLHYWLINMRGGENVLEEFCRLFPDADLYTHACDPNRISRDLAARRIHETFIGKLPGARRSCQKYLPLMPMALKRLDLAEYDLLISSESGPVKGVRKGPDALHICYCHTPMRYLWDMYDDYYRWAGPAGKLGMRLFRNYLRRCDLESAESVDHFIANSRFVAERIKRIYGRESEVIHPPVDTAYFSGLSREPEDYYLFVGQLNEYKRPDLALGACMQLGRRLVIVGDGPMRQKLEKSAAASPFIRFTGQCSREELRQLYAGARALLFPGTEDFGIVPLEAQAAGAPVIALGAGGALETILPDQTGLFFDMPSTASLLGALEEFESRSWDPVHCRKQAETFTQARFRREFSAFLHRAGVEIH